MNTSKSTNLKNELSRIYNKPAFQFNKLGKPTPAFGQVWSLKSPVEWLQSKRGSPLNIPIVITKPLSHAGLLPVCSVVGINELRGMAAYDDIYCVSEDRLPDTFNLALWMSGEIFPGQLEECLGILSDRTAGILRRRLDGEKIEDPFRELSGEPIFSETDGRLDFRRFMFREFLAFCLPVGRYLNVWKKMSEVLDQLDTKEIEDKIQEREKEYRLQEKEKQQIDMLLNGNVFPEELVMDARQAGEVFFGGFNLDQINSVLHCIDRALDTEAEKARRARIFFLHKCFGDSGSFQVLELLNQELQEVYGR